MAFEGLNQPGSLTAAISVVWSFEWTASSMMSLVANPARPKIFSQEFSSNSTRWPRKKYPQPLQTQGDVRPFGALGENLAQVFSRKIPQLKF